MGTASISARKYHEHGAGTVGFGDLGHHTQGVWELFLVWQHGSNTTTVQTTMVDFTTTNCTHTTTLAYR